MNEEPPKIYAVGEAPWEQPVPMPQSAPTERPSKAIKTHTAKGKSSSRFAVLNAFVDFGMVDLDHPSRSVWLVLFRDTKPEGLARTAQTDIARRIGMSVSTVKRAIRKLETLGMLTVKYQGGFGGRLSVYRVHPIPDKGVTALTLQEGSKL
jgi:hypothetical protein